jgi:rhamnosyltransferase
MIEGILVLYNPDEKVIINLHSYIEPLNRLWVIDNTKKADEILVKEIVQISEKIKYYHNANKNGIAGALNIGVKLALKNGAKWVLTMDQDSSFEYGHFKTLINKKLPNIPSNIFIISPYHKIFESTDYPHGNTTKIDYAMNSGSIINLKMIQKIGLFNENFFIDNVDVEYCLRARAHGYEILRINTIVLNHNLGDSKKRFKRILITNHSALRRYYITRNRLYTLWEYKFIFPWFCFKELKMIILDSLKIIFFEKEKLKKLKNTSLGIIHFFLGRKGKYEANV